MKKALSLALTLALTTSAFAGIAGAAELTTNDKFETLKTQGIFAGVDATGAAGLDQGLTRASLAVILSKLNGKVEMPSASTYTDVSASHWAKGWIGAAKNAELLVGSADNKFMPAGAVTIEEIAVGVSKAKGLKEAAASTLTNTSSWAKLWVQTALDNGLIAPQTDYKAVATRGALVDSTYLVYQSQTALALTTAVQTGAKKITVSFSKAVTAAEKTALTFELKNGLVNYPVTSAFADDNKSVVLTATFLPAADYTLTVKGFAAKTVKVEAEAVTTIEIGAASLQTAADQDLKVKALNQFKEEVKNVLTLSSGTNSNISVVSSVYGNKTVSSGKVDLSMEAVDTTVIVTVNHPATGKFASKTFKLVAKSSATTLTLGTVAPLKDKTRISVTESGLVLPYTMIDQYGAALLLPARAAGSPVASEVVIGDVKFVVSDSAIIDAAKFTVNADGVLTFTAGTKAGTAVITAFNSKTGAYNTTSVKVEDATTLKTFQVSNPGVLVVQGEDVIFPYIASDTYGAAIANKDVPAAVTALQTPDATKFRIEANGTAVPYVWKANGDLQIKFTDNGTKTLYVWVNGAIASQLNIDVKAPAHPVSISGTKDLLTTLTINGAQDLAFDKFVVVDNYGRTMSATDFTVAYSQADVAAGAVSLTTAGKVTGLATGTEKVTVTLSKATFTSVTFDITFTVIANDKVKTIALGTVGTLYDNGFTSIGAAGDYKKELAVEGKTAEGITVAILASDFVDLVTTSNSAVIGKDSVALSVYGVDKGTATVTIWKSGTKLAEQEVTVSDAAPVAKSIKFKVAEKTISATVTPSFDAATLLEVKDQYGVEIAKTGTYYSSNTAAATVVGSTVTRAARGITTITFVHANGVSATLILNVE